jgi:hypothetical protein
MMMHPQCADAAGRRQALEPEQVRNIPTARGIEA